RRLAPHLLRDFVRDVHCDRRPHGRLLPSAQFDPLYIVNSGSPRPDPSRLGTMESDELASVIARLRRRSVFVQRTRHLLPDHGEKAGNMKRVRKSRRQKLTADAVRQRIVDAARAHFFSHGFRSVTMDDLAAEMGIRKKTLYAPFPSKIALLEAVLANKFAGVEAKLREVSSAYPHDFPTALHELLAKMQRELDEIKPPFVRDMRQKAPRVFKTVEHRRAALIERFFGKLFIEGQRTRMVRKDVRARLMIEILLAMVQAIM